MRVSGAVYSVGVFLRRVWRRHRWSLPLSIGSAISFARLAAEMREGEMDPFDLVMQRRIDSWRGSVDELMMGFTRGGDILPMTAVTACSLAALLVLRRRREATYLLIGAGGGLLLNTLLKAIFQRARPGAALAYVLPSPSSLSFPSGHTMGTTGVVGSLLVILHVVRAPRPVQWAAIAVGGATLVGVGLSRVYFGAHYPSDVAGGVLAAAAWVSAVTGWMYPRLLPGEDDAPRPAP